MRLSITGFRRTGDGSVSNGPQSIEGSQVDGSVRNNGRCRHGFTRVILGHDFEVTTGFDHRHFAIAGGQVNVAIRVHR